MGGPDAICQADGMDEYDVVVIGGGPVGENAAQRVIDGGLTAALVESELLGGECSYWACMPSKALLRAPGALRAARTVRGAAQAVTGDLDVAETFARRDSFTSNWKDDGQVSWAKSAGIEVVRGVGRLAGERQVAVTAEDGTLRTLSARQAVVVCTGSVPKLPPIPGLAEARPWGSREATSSKVVPHRMAILGGGVVGSELATAYAAFGAQVTMLVAGERLLAHSEPFAGDTVGAALRERGVHVRAGVKVTEVRRDGDGPTTLVVDGTDLVVDVFLVTTGRRPATDDIGLDTIQVTPEDFRTDDTCRVTAVDGRWLYACGDAAGRRLLTHMGKYEARICGDVILARARGEQVDPKPWSKHAVTADDLASTGVIFTEPEVASVGRTERQARAAGFAVRTVEYDIGNIAGAALHADGYTGHAKLVLDEARNVVVGATFVGPDVGELLHAATIAVVGEVPLDRLWHAVPAYPTISEVWLRLLETAGL